MNEIDWLIAELAVLFPDARIHVDLPERPNGNHWLDIRLRHVAVTVECRSHIGFGFFAKNSGYGEGPNEIVPTKEKALEKIVDILHHATMPQSD